MSDELAPAAGPLAGREGARGIAAYAGAQVVGKVMTFTWTVVAARVLGPADFGAFSYALALGLLTSALVEWGFDPVMVRRASQQPGRLERLFTASLAWQAALGVPAFAVAGTVLLLQRPDGATSLLLLVAAAAFLDQGGDSARSAAAVAGRQTVTSGALVVQRVLTALAICAAALGGLGLAGVSGAFFAGSVVGVLAHLRALRRIPVRLRRTSRADLADVARGTLYLGISALVLMALARADVLILEALRGEREVAAYAAAYRLFETVLFLLFAVNSGVFPRMAAQARDGQKVAAAVRSALAVVAVLYLPFAAVAAVHGREVVDLLFGADYAGPAGMSLALLGLAPLAFAIAYVGGTGLTAIDRTSRLLLSAIVATVVDLGLCALLIPAYGAPAAAAATTAAYGTDALISTLALRAAVGPLRLASALRAPAVGAVAVVVLLVVLPLPLLVELPVAAAGYLLVWWPLARRWDAEVTDLLAGLVRR